MKAVELTLLLLAVAVIVWLLWSRSVVARHATPVDPLSKEWRDAVNKAQATIGMAKTLHAEEPGSVLVKFALKTKRGTREHVWGQLESIGDHEFTASLETPMIEAEPAEPPPYILPHAALEDWLKFLPDGSVRGAFTVQAEIALAKAQGKRPPQQVQSLQGRFVDA